MRQTIHGAEFRRLIINAAASIEINKQALNDLNVFPVPDGDTGTNMSMTINAAANDLRKTEDPSLEQAANAAASAFLEYSVSIFSFAPRSANIFFVASTLKTSTCWTFC